MKAYLPHSIAGAVCVGLAAVAPLPSQALPLAVSAAVVAPPVERRDVRDLGRAAAATPVRIALTLNFRNKAELDQLVELQATPGSPLFRQYLTPAQFAAEFAPTPADYARVAASLQSAGFRITSNPANRTFIDAVASAPVAERYFHTELHTVAQAGYGQRYANATAATLPSTVGDVVSTVSGLDNLVKFTSQRVRAAAVPRATTADVKPQAGIRPDLHGPIVRTVGGFFAGIYPTGIARAYNYPSQYGINGTGHAIAIVIDSDIANSDLAAFWSGAGIYRTGTFSRVYVDGANPGISQDVGETAIDTELSSSLAPAANIYVYLIANLSDVPIEDAYSLAVANHNVDVTSSSFGGCEVDDKPFSVATDAIAEQGAAVGVTFTASSGDSGGDCEDVDQYGNVFFEPDIVDAPASDPHFLAIGGTALTVNPTTGARTSETAWSPGGSQGGGGGGVSSLWTEPSYQKGVPGMAVVPNIKVSPPDTQPHSGLLGRNLPDISLDASNQQNSYVAVYDTPDGGWTGYGGTSVSNPMFAALLTLQNQKAGSLAGYNNPYLYGRFVKHGYSIEFFDITSGSIGAGWTAKTGYDQATGIGSIENGTF